MAGQGHDVLGQWFAGLLDSIRHSGHGESVHNPQHADDHYVPGGTNWNGYSLESLVGMVGTNASPSQLEGLATRWRTNGSDITTGSDDLQQSLTTLMQYWNGEAADEASVSVAKNAAWLSNLGETTTQMAEPIDDSAGALRSAQSTMPGVPHNDWLAGAGGGAAAGFMIAGPIGAAFGAAFGGIASAFGFGSSKAKMKRKAVQTMTRFEQAAQGIDGTTPQYSGPANGVNPGDPGSWSHDPAIPGSPGAPGAPGANDPGGTPNPGGDPISTIPGDPGATAPSFVDTPPGRWTGITGWGVNGPGGGLGLPGSNGVGPGGLGPGALGPGGTGPGSLGPGGEGGIWGRPGTSGGGMPMSPGGMGARGGMGGDLERGGSRYGRGMNPGALGRGLTGVSDQERLSKYGRGLGGGLAAEEEERLSKYGRGLGGGLSAEEEGRLSKYGGGLAAEEEGGRLGRGSLGAADQERMNGRFGRGAGGMLGGEAEGRGGYGSGYGGGAGAGGRKEEDGEHRRKFPYEEDPFLGDLKAAPPVIGL